MQAGQRRTTPLSVQSANGELNITSLAPTAGILSPAVNGVPFCRVIGFYNHSGSGNETGSIGFELWLPDQSLWNQRYLGVGGGGFVGFVDVSGI